MGTRCSRRYVAALFVALAVVGTACSSDSDGDKQSLPATTSTSEAPDVEVPTTADGATAILLTTTTSAADTRTTTPARNANTTVTTTRSVEVVGATVTDAPREPHEEGTDNTSVLKYRSSAEGQPVSGRSDLDPLDFRIDCAVADDGHGACKLALTNRVTRSAQFPGGLHFFIVMQRVGDSQTERFEHRIPSLTGLRAGERADVEATFDLIREGTYNYNAVTTVAWP